MSIVTTLQLFGSIFFLGFLITQLMDIPFLEKIGISFPLGSGLITILFLAAHALFNMQLTGNTFLVCQSLAITSVCLLNFSKKKRYSNNQHPLKRTLPSLDSISIVSLIFLAIITGYTFFENTLIPVTDWDAIALYDFRAKVIAISGSLRDGISLGYFFQYPSYTSFLHAFGYFFDAQGVKIIYSLLFLSLKITFFALLKRKNTLHVALIGTLFLSVNPLIFKHATMAYTNLSYLVFISLGLIYLTEWYNTQSKNDLLIGSSLTLLSSWVRTSEPFWFVGCCILAFGWLKKRNQSILVCGSIMSIYLVRKIWPFFLNTAHLTSSANTSTTSIFSQVASKHFSLLFFITNTLAVTTYFFINIAAVTGYLFIPLLGALYFDFKAKQVNTIYFVIATCFAVIYAGTYIFSLYYSTWNLIPDSLQRLSMIMLPLIVYAIFTSKVWKELEIT